jgi:exosortase D (VPLPA-CTERM-specific)
MTPDTVVRNRSAPAGAIFTGLLASISVLIAFLAFSGPILELVRRWESQEEYSHGFLIPVIVAWLIWSRRDAIVASVGRPSWIGPALVLLAAAMHIIGKLSSLFVLSQLGFIVALLGIVLGLGGYSLLKVMFVPVIFLLFAIPLPYFIDAVLSYRLQLISSELGTAFIRLFQIPVFREGNVIDLGVYKLQVVEACSGLRYLYPLMSLGFLAAYFFQAPIWQRSLIFLSTIPITIVMNSLRIGIVGILVDHFGPQDADGFLHMFEGWIIFLACAGVLVAEMSLLARLASGKSFFQVFYPPNVTPSLSQDRRAQSFADPPLMGCFFLLCAAGLATLFVSTRQEILPERSLFAAFPTDLAGWRGHPTSLDKETRTSLGMTDYILSDYINADRRPVNFYVAYYATQRSGISPHSPSVCIPGNGWQILDFERTSYTVPQSNLLLPLNRVVIGRGSDRQLVYYWFDERGMKIANEYISKLYLLRDAMFRNRTDGALVRLTTSVYPGETEHDAEKRLQTFIQVLMPSLDVYLPSDNASKINPVMNSFTPDHS